MDCRPSPNDLGYILDMIAAYKDLRKANCDVCKELVDGFGLTPAGRRKKAKGSGAKYNGDTVDGMGDWVAVHEGCLPREEKARA